MNIAYLKKIMTETGLLIAPSPDTVWSLPEEKAWFGLCSLMGAHYTPYPDSIGQDPDFLEKIQTETLVVPRPAPPPTNPPAFDLKQFLPQPPLNAEKKPLPTAVPLDPETPARHARVFRSEHRVPPAFQPPRPKPVVPPTVKTVEKTGVVARPLQKRAAKMDRERSEKLNAAREATIPAAPANRPANGPIRVR